MAAYKLDLWRRLKKSGESAGNPLARLADIPADAEMDEGIVLGCWNGERFVSWEEWVATAPIEQDPNHEASAVLAETHCVSATCGSTRVRLVRAGDGWLMFAGTRTSRRRDFASPFLSHAQRTAEAWYGKPEKGWHVGAQG